MKIAYPTKLNSPHNIFQSRKLNCCSSRTCVLIFSVALIFLISHFYASLIPAKSSILSSKLTISFRNFSRDVEFNNDASNPTLIFTCLGELAFEKYQPYVWHALRQARMINPTVSIVVILSRAAYTTATGTITQDKLKALKITSVFHEDLIESNALLRLFREIFFVEGAMEPDGNKKFVQYAVERLVCVYAFMNQSNTLDVFHLENDNMLYINLKHLTYRMHICDVHFAFPKAAVNQAVTSFVYVHSYAYIEKFVRWCIDVFRRGPKEATSYINNSWLNDMTLGARYLQLNAASTTQSRSSGVYELPSTFLTKKNISCLCKPSYNDEPIIFDACVLGQYFGGTFSQPNNSYWDRDRLVDPRGKVLEWREDKNNRLKMPYIDAVRIINIHVHSKQLPRFFSEGSDQIVKPNVNKN